MGNGLGPQGDPEFQKIDDSDLISNFALYPAHPYSGRGNKPAKHPPRGIKVGRFGVKNTGTRALRRYQSNGPLPVSYYL